MKCNFLIQWSEAGVKSKVPDILFSLCFSVLFTLSFLLFVNGNKDVTVSGSGLVFRSFLLNRAINS